LPVETTVKLEKQVVLADGGLVWCRVAPVYIEFFLGGVMYAQGGTLEYLQDTRDWSGRVIPRGEKEPIGLWPGSGWRVNIAVGGWVHDWMVGGKLSYENLLPPFAMATDIYNPEGLGGGVRIGVVVGREIRRRP
jgi:hypothetical protein